MPTGHWDTGPPSEEPPHICESKRGSVSKGKDSVGLFKEGGESANEEEITHRNDNLTVALSRPPLGERR